MPNIQINIKDKVARADRAIIVCDNSDYTAVFDFDAEWSAYDTKTARFVYCGKYTDVVFSGNSCPIPEIHDTRSLTVGVYAGDLHTTTPAHISCVPSILCGNGIPADPTPDVYAQIMELLNKESGVWYPTVDDAGNMSWTRSMSETEPQPVNIKGPKGDAGADGVGIPGTDGKDGVDGKSAYELAQDNGFQGTMQEWLASLVGADGTNGVDGNDGVSPAVSVAAITGGNRVTITDAEGTKTFDVMDGAQGASGADGKDYVLTDTDKQEIAEAAAGLVDVPSVQPDWNQNDDTQPDYIKNRPFYTGDPVVTVLVEEQTVAFSDIGGVYGVQGWPTEFDAVVGKTYTVSWDGTEYECECLSMQGMPYIGNLAVAGVENDTGEPFIFVNQGAWVIATTSTEAEHLISISSFTYPIVKIEEKYLPEHKYISYEEQELTDSQKEIARNNINAVDNSIFIEISTNVISASDFDIYYEKHKKTGLPIKWERAFINYIFNRYTNEGIKTYELVSGGQLYSMTEYIYNGQKKVSHSSWKVEPRYIYAYQFSMTNPNNSSIRKILELNNYGKIVTNDGYEIMMWNGGVVVNSSTKDSTKKFKITVDDSGTITATEVS